MSTGVAEFCGYPIFFRISVLPLESEGTFC